MLNLRSCVQSTVANEFEGAQLGDLRRTRRLQRIAECAMRAPQVGFPRMVADDSELEGLYRFFACKDIEPEDVLEPHVEATVRRMRDARGPVLVVHDTTDLRFGGLHAREGLGPTNGNQQGFLLHHALAVLPGEARLPLGTCGMIRIRRTERKNTNKKSWYLMSKDPNRESLRWGKLVEQVQDRSDGVELIHLMDREGDNYDLFALMLRNGARFVVRGCHDRALATSDRLLGQLAELKPKAHRHIELSERLDDGKRTRDKRTHPLRGGRSARVAVAGCTVTINKTHSAHAPEEALTLNVVRVWEPRPPRGEPAVSWVLYTTEPIRTAEQLLAVVDYYRSRWVIEEFFKALKTGCSIEKRQLESYRALSLALAMFLPIAWRLLLIRSVSRKAPNAPATTIATNLQLRLLRHKLKLQGLPETAEAAAYAIAKLGGHLKRNGPPGWQTLGRGFEALLLMEAGWRTAMDGEISDQS